MALREICRKNTLFEPSFPFHSTDLLELQRAALGPTLWHRKVSRARTSGTKLMLQEGPLEFRIPPPTAGSTYHCVSLIPGGRYLLTGTSQGKIDVWDLGIPGGPRKTPGAIGSIKIEHGTSLAHVGTPSRSQTSLRFAVLLVDLATTGSM